MRICFSLNSIFKTSSSIIFDTNLYGVSFIIIGDYSPVSDSPVSPTRRDTLVSFKRDSLKQDSFKQDILYSFGQDTLISPPTGPYPPYGDIMTMTSPPGLIFSMESSPSILDSPIKRPSLPRRQSGYTHPYRKLKLPKL